MNNQGEQSTSAERKQGLPVAAVAGGALAVFALLLFMVYILANELLSGGAGTLSSTVQQVADNIEQQPRSVAQPTSVATAMTVTKTTAATAVPVAPGGGRTLDIGAYLTYGGQAISLARASAVVSPEGDRLVVGFYEVGAAAGERPALSAVFTFLPGSTSCSLQSLKSYVLLFSLRQLGPIAAQRVQLVRSDRERFSGELTNFSCSLKRGGVLDLQLVGSDSNLLKPRGSTFGWGARLKQEIG